MQPSSPPISDRLLTSLIGAAHRAKAAMATPDEASLLIELGPELLEELAAHRATLRSLFSAAGNVVRIDARRAPRLVPPAGGGSDLGGAA